MNNRLRELRAENDLSQAELGGRVGVSRQAINLVENGKHDPSLSLAFAIARVFGLPVEAIFVEE
jgi:putative transcriptional regulator